MRMTRRWSSHSDLERGREASEGGGCSCDLLVENPKIQHQLIGVEINQSRHHPGDEQLCDMAQALEASASMPLRSIGCAALPFGHLSYFTIPYQCPSAQATRAARPETEGLGLHALAAA